LPKFKTLAIFLVAKAHFNFCLLLKTRRPAWTERAGLKLL